MICPQCNAWTRTLETRDKFDGTIHRRYECANLHRFNTMESVVIIPLKLPNLLREVMRRDYPQGATVSELANALDKQTHDVHEAIRRMRDVYIKEWINNVVIWALAESERDKPPNAPKSKGKP